MPREKPVPHLVLTILFALALALRLLGLMARHEMYPPSMTGDLPGAEAGVMAKLIVEGHGFVSPYDRGEPYSPSTHLAPVYVYFLAGLMKWLSLDGVFYVALLVNLVAGAVLPVVVVRVGEVAGFGKVASLLAGVAMCFCPEGFRAVGLVWDEALFVTISAALVWWMLVALRRGARWGDSVWMGLVQGVFALLNPAMVMAMPVAWMAGLRAVGVGWKRVVVHGVIFVGMIVVGSSPWHVRNFFLLDPPAKVFLRGPFWLATWSSMHTLEIPQYPDGRKGLPQPLHPWNRTEEMAREEGGVWQRLTEAEYFAYCKERVMAEWKAHPRAMVGHWARQFNAFWVGTAEAQRWGKNPWVFFVAQGVPAVLGLAGLWMARKNVARWAMAVMVAMLVVFPVPYYISDGSMRYRHPIDFVLCLGMGWLGWEGLARMRAKRRPQSDVVDR